jgi:hypothetical protein
MKNLITRRLGRTGWQVTTLGLGGQASIQWPAAGVDSAAIIEKAYRLGVNYLDTSNIYGPSQQHFGEAFRRLGLSPAAANYDPAARGRIYIATKTHILNLLHRLVDGKPGTVAPIDAPQALSLRIEPKADAALYDGLRRKEAGRAS